MHACLFTLAPSCWKMNYDSQDHLTEITGKESESQDESFIFCLIIFLQYKFAEVWWITIFVMNKTDDLCQFWKKGNRFCVDCVKKYSDIKSSNKVKVVKLSRVARFEVELRGTKEKLIS